jgi:putative endonuclease
VQYRPTQVKQHHGTIANERKTRGEAAEQLAASFLTQRGLTVLERNWRVRGGEIDLICQDGRTLVFVEVRLRMNTDYGGSAASINDAKQRRLILAARHYLAGKAETFCRFDALLLDSLVEARIVWLKNAFDAP